MPAIKGKKKHKEEMEKQDIIYPELVVVKHYYEKEISEGEKCPLLAKDAMSLLGWQTEEDWLKEAFPEIDNEEDRRKAYGGDGHPFSSEYFFIDFKRDKVRLLKNWGNRPFDEKHCYRLAQTILKREWAGPTCFPGETVNGEPILIGRSGRVLSGQHRLIALVLAHQIWSGVQSVHWTGVWPEQPSMDTIIVYGISEDKNVTRTIDNVKSRSTADVLFADVGMFPGENKADRIKLAKYIQSAIKLLWQRTGASENAFAPQQTTTGDVSFIDRHGRLKDAMLHIYGLDNNPENPGGISYFINPGYACTLMYLYGASASAGEKYWAKVKNDEADESGIKWTNWSKAKAFWTALALGEKSIREVIKARRPVVNEDGIHEESEEGDITKFIFAKGPTGGSIFERISVLNQAWNLFLSGKEITAASLMLRYKRCGSEGMEYLELDREGMPVIGGIDFESAYWKKKAEAKAIEESGDIDPEEKEEIEERIREEKDKKDKKKRKTNEEETEEVSIMDLPSFPEDDEDSEEYLDRDSVGSSNQSLFDRLAQRAAKNTGKGV